MDFNKENEAHEAITVAIRMRPLAKNECDNQRVWKVLPKYNSITQTTSAGKPLSERITGRTYFAFDKVFDENVPTDEVYNDVAKGVVSAVVNGLNGTIFAYGQTSSGKTYTMQGSGSIQEGACTAGGIVHMAARDIFSIIESQSDRMFLVRASFLEIYNEEVRDLLSSSGSTLPIREDPRRGVFVQSQEEMAADFNGLLTLLFQGEKSRQVASTGMNERSSRSHTIFRITIESRENEDDVNNEGSDGAVRISTLNLVDLAGSESVRHTGATGDRQKEGGMINQSLLTLSRVIVALGQPNPIHVNFRDSKLTRILQPSLSGNARMAVICCATPSELYLEETRSTLQFASRAKLVKTNAQVNEVLDDRSIIRRLQRELAEARGQTTASVTEHLRNLENKAAYAGTEAMEAKKKFDRLTRSILNATSLFLGSRSSPHLDNDGQGVRMTNHDVKSRKRRQSDGMIELQTGSTPMKESSTATESPKTTSRISRQKTNHPQLSQVAELSILREAFRMQAKSSMTLKHDLENSNKILQQKDDFAKGLEGSNNDLARENELILSELSLVQSALKDAQGNLESATRDADALLMVKETAILTAIQDVETGNQRIAELEATNKNLSERLLDLQGAFDLLQQERVRSAFDLAQVAEEKEILQIEREKDKLIIAEMNQKIGILTSQANDAERKYTTLQDTVSQFAKQQSLAAEEKAASDALASETQYALENMARELGEERQKGELCRHELESQLEWNVQEKETAWTTMFGLEEQLRETEIEIARAAESTLQAISVRDARIAELVDDLSFAEAEKDGNIARTATLYENLQAVEVRLGDAQKKIAELEELVVHERETSAKALREVQANLETMSLSRTQAEEQAALFKFQVETLEQAVLQGKTKNDEIQRRTEELRFQADSEINELRILLNGSTADKISAFEKCADLELQMTSLMKSLEGSQLHTTFIQANLVDLEEKYRALENDCQLSRSREVSLLEDLEAIQVDFTNLQQEIEAISQDNVELESCLRESRDENNVQITKLLRDKDLISAEKVELEDILLSKERSLLALQSRYTDLRTQVTSKEIEKSDLVNQVGMLSGQLEAILSQCNSLNSTVEQLRTAEASLRLELAANQERHERVTKSHQAKEQELEKIQKSFVVLLEEKSEIERLQKASEEESSLMRDKYEKSEDRYSEQQLTMKDLEEKLNGTHLEREELQRNFEKTRKTIEAMTAEIREAREDLGRCETDKIQMECLVMSVETEKMALMAEHDAFQVNQQECMQMIEDKLSEKEERIEQLTRERCDLAMKLDEYARLAAKSVETEAAVSQIQAQLEAAEERQKESTSNEQELARRLQSSMCELTEARSTISALQLEKSILGDQLQEMGTTSTIKLKSLEAELSAIQESRGEADRRLHCCVVDLEHLRSAKEQAVNTLMDREQERDKAVSEVEELQSTNQELMKQLSNALYGETKNILEKEILDLRHSSLELKQLLASTTGSEARLRERVATAERELLSRTRALEDSNYRLSQLEEELRQCEMASEQKMVLDSSEKNPMLQPHDLLSEIESMKSILVQERKDRQISEDDLRKQMGIEQRMLIQEGEKLMEDLRCKVQDLETKLSQSEREAYASRQQLDELRDETQSSRNACKDLEHEMNQMTSKLSHKDDEVLSLHDKLRVAKAELYSLKENAIELKETAKSDAISMETLERENAVARSEVAQLKRQLAGMEMAKVGLQAELDRLTTEAHSGSNNITQNTQHREQLNDLEVELSRRGDKIKQLQGAIQSARQESEGSSRLTEELQNLKSKLIEKDQRIKKLQQFKLTKEFAEEYKQLKKDNKHLREEVVRLQSSTTGSEETLRSELGELRFDKEALEKKLRKYAVHCQRLEDDKVGMIDTLRTCNVNIASADQLNDAVASLCRKLSSLQAKAASVGSTDGEAQERERQAFQTRLEQVTASEQRLSEQVVGYRKEISELRKSLKKVSEPKDSENVAGSDVTRKLRYLEQENLQLLYDVKTSKKQLQSAREEIEVLRLNTADNSTLDFGSVDLNSNSSINAAKFPVSDRSSSSPEVKKVPLSDKTHGVLNTLSRGISSNKHPNTVVPPRKTHANSDKRSAVPGLGEASIQGDETGECTQS